MTTYKPKSAALAFTITFGLTAATIIATSVPARAAPAQGLSRVVHAGDLDLTTADGRNALQTRIARTAERLCVEPSERKLSTQAIGRKCIADTIAKAAPQIAYAIRRDYAERQSASLTYPSQP